MRVSKKRKSEIYALIDLWRSSDKSQKQICNEAGFPYSNFKYWIRKQKAEQALSNNKPVVDKEAGFIPVTVDKNIDFEELRICYPNGVSVVCSNSIALNQLKELINLF